MRLHRFVFDCQLLCNGMRLWFVTSWATRASEFRPPIRPAGIPRTLPSAILPPPSSAFITGIDMPAAEGPIQKQRNAIEQTRPCPWYPEIAEHHPHAHHTHSSPLPVFIALMPPAFFPEPVLRVLFATMGLSSSMTSSSNGEPFCCCCGRRGAAPELYFRAS